MQFSCWKKWVLNIHLTLAKSGLELVDGRSTINDLAQAPAGPGGLTHGAPPMQMAAAYGAIGNDGIYVKPH
jgi:penicillin-binding protein 1A